jgi:hypothetical protein
MTRQPFSLDHTKSIHLWHHPYSDILARLRALGAFAFGQKQFLENELLKTSHKKRSKGSSLPPTVEKEKDTTFKLCDQLGLHHVRPSSSLFF